MKHLVLTALLCAITLNVAAFAITPEEAKKVSVTMSLSNTPVAKVLEYVSLTTNIKTHYAAAKDDAVITVNFSGVPAEEVFTQVGQLAKLSVTYKDDGVYFEPKK
ncbi:MAG: hypothetical protein RLZZ408_1179 [Verrucomicrobiota bacterium]|jgi:hypothetical protein